jgi:hypothetical protein
MRSRALAFPVSLAWGLLLLSGLQAHQIKEKQQVWDGSQTTPVHRLPLKDEFDQPILPTESYSLPYSSRYTCAPCHDYRIIQQGLHFNSFSAGGAVRRGEPWVWVDPATGTVLPLSYQGWPGTWDPQDLGLKAWDFTLLFARHMTGGGVSEVSEMDFTPESRWEVSGILDINCMGCHNASRLQDHSEWAKQVMRENFRWAATAASGIGSVSGMASRLPATWDVFDGPNPDDTEWAVVPNVDYRPEMFDPKHRVFFDIADKIEDQRCLNCHSVTEVGKSRFHVPEDVHAAAGIRCVDCHRHDLSHRMIQGYEGETGHTGNPEVMSFSCRGCHLGESEEHSKIRDLGRLGAPKPQHAGIPAVHFERLACTVCHSGPLPDLGAVRIRTSRANRLGIYGVAQWATDYPQIQEPVFARGTAEKLLPHRVMWPSYWVRFQEDSLIPMSPAQVLEQGQGILDHEAFAAQILALLSMHPDLPDFPVLLVAGKIFSFNPDGGLDAILNPKSKESHGVLWGLRTDSEILPLIPDFDPHAEEPDMDAETRIQLILESLDGLESGPGQPAVIHRGMLYSLVEGFLNIAEYPEETGQISGLFWIKEDKAEPLVSEFQLRTILALCGEEETLTEEQVQHMLERLSQDGGRFGYISGGRLFRLDEGGALEAVDHAQAQPVLWPLAHPVRPAQQSLGVKGCTQCHKEGSRFFFHKLQAAGPLLTDRSLVRAANSFMGLDGPYQRLFGLSFRVRPLLKILLGIAAAVLGVMIMIVLVSVLGRATGLIEKRK